MVAWREAKSLLTLRDEYNARFPNRSKASDGMLGDAAHASRVSDHNPWIVDRPGPNVVSAIDLTRDSAPGVADTAQWLVDHLVKSRDRRIKYLIHNHKIWRSYSKPGIPAWTPAPYHGANAHEHHAHISVNSDKADYDSTRPWLVATPEEEDDMTEDEVRKIVEDVLNKKDVDLGGKRKVRLLEGVKRAYNAAVKP